MAEHKWTREQGEAIMEEECNLLVAAAAGSGKTAVLVERIIRKITDEKNPLDIDRLLIVTFTNAAATEMRERIGAAISRRLEDSPRSDKIRRQLTLLGKARITTIHSFCLDVIRSNFQNIGIDPGFRIADETESSLMKMEALNELFEEQYKEENGDFMELLECYGGTRDDQALQEMVLNLYNFIQSSPWPGEWLAQMSERMNVAPGTDFAETPWGTVLLAAVRLGLEALHAMTVRALDLLRYAPGLEKYQAVYAEDLARLDTLVKLLRESGPARWDSLFRALEGMEFATLPRAGKDADKEKQETVKKLRDEVKTRLKNLRDKIVRADSAAIIDDLTFLYPKMKSLAALAASFSAKYREKKNRKTVVDFNDLEHFCLEILAEKQADGKLQPSPAALGYRDRFAEILVDEYQDSNLVQEMIIAMISRVDAGRPNVFMVGDVKQSIYRFRQARPELFLEKYRTYGSDRGSLFRKILLLKNFRSRREVVDAVNFIFTQIMSVHAGELDYTGAEALNPGAIFPPDHRADGVPDGETELHLIRTGAGEAPGPGANEDADGPEDGARELEDEDMPDQVQCEARLVARRILDLIMPDEEGRRFRVFDQDRQAYRPAEFRDIVVLLRTTRNWSEVFVEEFSALGIPAFADTGTGFFKTVEVQVALSLLQVIDNPLQDIPLLAVLRSPVVSFTTGALAELRLADRKAPLFHALQKLARDGQGEAAEKAGAFLARLERWRDMSLYLSTDRLLWQLYQETGYYGMVGAMPGGEQRQANLSILFERARQFEETSYKGVFNFINFVDKLKSHRGDMGSAKVLGEKDNVVRIMSIHKSKGLEFPVVILAGCGKKFNLQDMNKSILLHQDLGFGPDVVDYRLRLSWPSAAKQAIREKIKAETLSEEMRILYVALTRAREKLIITGSVKDPDKARARWCAAAESRESRLPDYEILKGGNYLDWIGPALIRHRGCGALREGAGSQFRGLLLDDPSVWRIRIWHQSEVLAGRPVEEGEKSEFLRWLDGLEGTEEPGPVREEISRRLSWDYPYAGTTVVPAKVSVTELKRRFNIELSEEADPYPRCLPSLVKKPKFLEEKKGLSAAEAGTVLHFVMQHLDFSRKDVEAQLAEMEARDLLTARQARTVETEKIRRFLNSPLGQRMLVSNRINREVPFNLEIPCHELYPDLGDQACRGETLLLQGVIDCYFEEPDGIVLLDYKTDYVPTGKAETVRERYRVQINYYARALELLAGKRVKEKYICLFRIGEVLEY